MPRAGRDHRQESPGEATLVWLVVALFFIWGGVTSLNDILVPKLRGLFSLSYLEVMFTQFAFFAAYFVISIPAGRLVARLGYVRGLVAGLAVMSAGAFLVWPATESGVYWTFLIALFVLASGITVLQVAANPLINALGDPSNASSRLTFAQAFNSLGTTIWPYVGAGLFLDGAVQPASPLQPAMALAARPQRAAIVGHVYVAIAVVLAIVALVFWTRRRVLPVARFEQASFPDSLTLLREPRIAFGALSLFLYVGAEVSIGSLLVNFLELPVTLGLSPQAAGEHLSFYWGGAMVGRFFGSRLLRRVVPGKLLAVFAAAALGLLIVALGAVGIVAGWSLIAVGLCNSIMFPTIFSLALEGQGNRTPEVSGLLCMAIVGGAIVPLITGSLADVFTIPFALLAPMICYAVIASFGLTMAKRRPA